MPYFLVDLWLDGYEDERELQDACVEFIKEQLDFTASSVHVYPINEDEGESLKNKILEEK